MHPGERIDRGDSWTPSVTSGSWAIDLHCSGFRSARQILVLEPDSNRRTYLVATGLWLVITLGAVVMVYIVASQPAALLKVVPVALDSSYRTCGSARKAGITSGMRAA